MFTHHRAPSERTGMVGGTGLTLKSAPARICRKPGGRVDTIVFVHDLDLQVPNVSDTGDRVALAAAQRRKQPR